MYPLLHYAFETTSMLMVMSAERQHTKHSKRFVFKRLTLL